MVSSKGKTNHVKTYQQHDAYHGDTQAETEMATHTRLAVTRRMLTRWKGFVTIGWWGLRNRDASVRRGIRDTPSLQRGFFYLREGNKERGVITENCVEKRRKQGTRCDYGDLSRKKKKIGKAE